MVSLITCKRLDIPSNGNIKINGIPKELIIFVRNGRKGLVTDLEKHTSLSGRNISYNRLDIPSNGNIKINGIPKELIIFVRNGRKGLVTDLEKHTSLSGRNISYNRLYTFNFSSNMAAGT